jgi:two-component system phosphate regulon sensor histidine kinase PhoR
MDVTRIRALEKMRSDFVANVTHELRTPLTSIKGYVETLRGGAAADPAIRERFLQIIDIEAERLHALITDILELSDIEAGSPDAGAMSFSLESVVRDVSDLMGGKAREKAVTLRTDVPGDLMMTANPDRIKQMLLNLVDNAVKYNVEGAPCSSPPGRTGADHAVGPRHRHRHRRGALIPPV